MDLDRRDQILPVKIHKLSQMLETAPLNKDSLIFFCFIVSFATE